MATRVFGWLFLNYSHMAWKEYQKPRPTFSKHFYWQLHHENNKPKYTLADKLRIVSYCTNQRERARSNKNNSLHASSDDALHSE